MTKDKQSNPTSVRLNDVEKQLQKRLAAHIGVSENDVLRMGLRSLAKQEGIQIEDSKTRGEIK